MKTLRGIFLFELLPVLIVVAGAATAYHFYGQRAARKDAERHLRSAAQVTAELIHREIAPLNEMLRSTLMQEAVGNYLRAERTERRDKSELARLDIERSLERLGAENPRIESIELYTVHGDRFATMVPDDGDPGGAEVIDQPWFATTFAAGRYLGFEAGGRIRLGAMTARVDRYGPPVIASMVYDFRGSVGEAARFATRHLNEVQVRIDTPAGQPRFRYGELPSDGRTLEAGVPMSELEAHVTVRQTAAAALANFRQAERVLLVPLTIVTLGLLLVAGLGTQRIVRDLREAQRRTEEANSAKSEFLANMSHEIRTPMNGILGMLELLQTARLRPQEHEYLEMAHESATSLLRLLNDILDFSKIEAGCLELEYTPFDVRQSIEGTLSTLAVKAGEKGLRLGVHVEDDVPRRLVGDAGRLRQILVNLVGNAIKFTPEGEIQVTACLVANCRARIGTADTGSRAGVMRPISPAVGDSGPPPLCLWISVRDTGIGIPADKQTLILDAFHQGDRSISRQFGGTGLGLAIASELAGMMGGHLWLESVPGRGSTFHFTVRLAVAGDEPSGSKDSFCRPGEAALDDHLPGPARSARILLAEDGKISQKVAARLLERRGHSVVVAENGREALEAIQREDFDLVLMDVEMPEMDGLQATRAIRALQCDAEQRVPIIAMTAHAIKGDRERFLAAGMDDYLAKPVSSRLLYETVEKYLKPLPPPALLDSDAPLPTADPVAVR